MHTTQVFLQFSYNLHTLLVIAPLQSPHDNLWHTVSTPTKSEAGGGLWPVPATTAG